MEQIDLRGFRPIYGYPQYLVNEIGQVYSKYSQKLLKYGKSYMLYNSYGGKKVYRLNAITLGFPNYWVKWTYDEDFGWQPELMYFDPNYILEDGRNMTWENPDIDRKKEENKDVR